MKFFLEFGEETDYIEKYDKKTNNINTNIDTNEQLRVSFLIMAHKNPSQIVSFINALDCQDVSFFVHIDAKSDIINHSSLQELKNKENVFFLDCRQKVTWAGYGEVAATLLLLKECLEKVECDYISLHSGQDLPIKNKNEIFEFLKRNQGKEFIEFFKIPREIRWWPTNDGGLDRLHYYWYIDKYGFDKAFELYKEQKKSEPKRKYPEDIQPYGGWQWWTITRECAEYIVDYINQNESFCDFYKYTLFPCEGFFQTIILNSHFKGSVLNNDLRYIDWHTGPHYPRILTKQDYNRLLTSDKLFARKFDITIDKNIVEIIADRTM